MTGKKDPERTCISCRKKFPKKELIRIVRDKNGNITLDENGKVDGRGVYVCKNKECLEKFFKTKALNRAYKRNIAENVYNDIKEKLQG